MRGLDLNAVCLHPSKVCFIGFCVSSNPYLRLCLFLDAAQWDADIHDNHSPSLTSCRGFERGKAWQKYTGNAIDRLNARSCTGDAHLYECVMRTMSGDDAAAVVMDISVPLCRI